MSHKVSIRELTSGRGTSLGLPAPVHFPEAWTPDVTFLRSWLVYDSAVASAKQRGKFNWNFLIGVLLAAGVSALFWLGIGMAVAHLR